MNRINAVRILDEPPVNEPAARKRERFNKDVFIRRYAITLVLAAAFTIYTILLSSAVKWETEKSVRQELDAEYDEKIETFKEEYKKEQQDKVQAEYWLSGEASLENQINAETDLLSRVDIWTTDDAYLTFVCNVWVRVMRADYPGSVVEVLKQDKQYDFFDETKPIDEHRREITKPLLQKLHKGIFPANLTTDFAWLEMQKDGAVCVLHSRDRYYTNGDETWRYHG